jgi:hypothetical protein
LCCLLARLVLLQPLLLHRRRLWQWLVRRLQLAPMLLLMLPQRLLLLLLCLLLLLLCLLLLLWLLLLLLLLLLLSPTLRRGQVHERHAELQASFRRFCNCVISVLAPAAATPL